MYADLALRLPSTSARWASPEFRDRADRVGHGRGRRAALIGAGPATGPGRRSGGSRPPSGTYFAKQNTPLQAFEARLLTLLGDLAPASRRPGDRRRPGPGPAAHARPGHGAGRRARRRRRGDLLPVIRRMLGEAASCSARWPRTLSGSPLRASSGSAPSDALPYVQQRLDDFAAPAGRGPARRSSPGGRAARGGPALDRRRRGRGRRARPAADARTTTTCTPSTSSRSTAGCGSSTSATRCWPSRSAR